MKFEKCPKCGLQERYREDFGRQAKCPRGHVWIVREDNRS